MFGIMWRHQYPFSSEKMIAKEVPTTIPTFKVMQDTSLVAQWLRFRAPNAGGPQGSIPGQGTRSPMHAATKSLQATTKELSSRN